MNGKHGQVALVGLMIGIMIFILAMIFIDPITDVITEVRGTNQLNCSSVDISDSQKGTCLIVDLILPYFIAIIIAVAGAWITAKFIGG
jgi:hypothetical protein